MTNLINLSMGIIGGCVLYFFTPLNTLGFEGGVFSFLLSYPWRFGKTILSLWGGVNPEGSVYSLCSVYSDAGGEASAIFSLHQIGYNTSHIFGIGLQFARNNAEGILGIAIQFAGDNAEQVLGIALWQNAGRKAVLGFGIPLYQKGEEYAGVSWKELKK